MFKLYIPFPDISPFVFKIPQFAAFGHFIGPLGLRWYSVGYIIGILIAWFILNKLSEKHDLWPNNKSPFNKTHIDDFIFNATIGIIFGGRIGYAILYSPDLLTSFSSLIKVWEGGMSFHGGITGVIIAVILTARAHKVPLLCFADAVAISAPIGIGLVRIANFINQELYGRPTDAPWGVIFDTDTLHIPRHPSQLYEAMCEGFILFIILFIAVFKFKSFKKSGLTTGIFFVWYAISRIILENFREPDAIPQINEYITRGMLYSLPLLLLGIFFIINSLKPNKK